MHPYCGSRSVSVEASDLLALDPAVAYAHPASPRLLMALQAWAPSTAPSADAHGIPFAPVDQEWVDQDFEEYFFE